MLQNVNRENDVSKDTAFGTANSIYFSDNYPFVIDGETKYFARIEFNCTTDTTEINSWLMANGATNLGRIVDQYWGSAALTRLKTDSNVLFCTEPIQIVSSVDDDGDLVAPNVGTRTVTYEKEFWKRVYDYFYDYTTNNGTDPHETKPYTTKFDINNDGVAEDDVYVSPSRIDDYDTQMLYDIIAARSYLYDGTPVTDLDLAKQFINELYDVNLYLIAPSHIDVIDYSWTQVVTEEEPISQHYKYIYGTARWIYDNRGGQSVKEYEAGSIVTNALGVLSYYDVPHWGCNAVYCDGIGQDGVWEYNEEYPNICFSEGARYTKSNGDIAPLFDGEGDITHKSDGRITTYGLSILAPAADNITWHELYDESHGFSKANKFNNNIELQSDSKYWFSTSEENRNTATSGFFDVTSSQDIIDYYKIVFNTDGTVWILTSKDSSFPANKTTVLEKLTAEQGLNDISNKDVIMLDKETNALTNMFNVMVRGAGNDVTATWTKTGKWHNEYVEVTLMKQNTQLEMKLAYPSQRTTVADTSLQAPSESKLDTFTKALKFNYTTNMNNLETLGHLRAYQLN